MQGIVTPAADIYSVGIVLLEMLFPGRLGDAVAALVGLQQGSNEDATISSFWSLEMFLFSLSLPNLHFLPILIVRLLLPFSSH